MKVMRFLLVQVPYAAFVPTHLLCTFTIGRATSLVVDVGAKETTILPVSLWGGRGWGGGGGGEGARRLHAMASWQQGCTGINPRG